jgi:signal transduction histidine kinase
MRKFKPLQEEALISQVPSASWRYELEKSSTRYHTVAAWAAIIFDPLFAVTDYFNIPGSWQYVFSIRIFVSLVTLSALILRKRYYLPSYIIVVVPFTLISLQNAYTYSLIGDANLLGHNLNYTALLIGAALFVAWDWPYSVVLTTLSLMATAYFIQHNPALELNAFFVKGGLILLSSFIFMTMLIQTRYNLTIREIKARLALQKSNEEIQAQNDEIQTQNEAIKVQNQEIQAQGEEIRGINENLESLVRERTAELEKKNKALEEYAFINAHKLRSPVASILGLTNLLKKIPTTKEGQDVLDHLQISADKLDEIVSSITKAIERGDKK